MSNKTEIVFAGELDNRLIRALAEERWEDAEDGRRQGASHLERKHFIFRHLQTDRV